MATEVRRASMNMKESDTANKGDSFKKTQQPAVWHANEGPNKMKRHKCLPDLAS